MKIDIDLPHLILKGVRYEDETFYYDGYKLEAWKGDITKLVNHIQAAKDFFFQEEMSINKDISTEIGLDLEYLTFELANLLFSNLEKAVAVWNATNKEYRFDEIELTWEGQGSSLFNIDGTDYDAYYYNELIEQAQQFHFDYINDMPISDTIGDIKYLSDYFDVIDTTKLADEIRAELDQMDMLNYMSEDTLDDDIKLIKAFVDMNDDYNIEDFIWDTLTDKELFDIDAYTQGIIDNESDAIDQMSGMIGDLIYNGQTVLDGWKPSTVYVFERYS